MKVVIINGAPGVGKDTFCRLCAKYALVDVYSSVTCVKQVATLLGWDGYEDDRSRNFLAKLKALSTEYNDFPFQALKRHIAKSGAYDICFLMIREPREIERAKQAFSAVPVLIRRKDALPVPDNFADRNVEDYCYDIIIENKGTLEELAEKARDFVREVQASEIMKLIGQ